MSKEVKRHTQNCRVLLYMNENGSITQLEALRELGVMRLASRISDLRKSGYRIKKEMTSAKNMYQEIVHFAKYSLMEET